MKKAFTMMELVVVIVIGGILAFFLMPQRTASQAYEAANQIITHLRYTQHLALNDDKFNPDDPDWTKTLWRMTFSQLNSGLPNGCETGWRYAVYQNTAGNRSDSGQPNGEDEAASNPAEPGKLLSACYNGVSTNTSDKLNLTKTFKIRNETDKSKNGMDFSEFAKATNGQAIQGVIFDDLGRAYPRSEWTDGTYPNNAKFAYDDGKCGRIKITSKDGSRANILIFRDTGFACIEGFDGCEGCKTPNP